MSRKKGVVLSYALMAVESLSGMLFTPYLIRSLGQEEYGIFSLVATITSYLYLLDLGVGNAVIRYMAKYRYTGDRRSERNLMAITIIFYGFIGCLIIVVGYILNNSISLLFGIGLTDTQQYIAKEMLQITSLNAAFTFIFVPMQKTLMAYERFVLSKSIDIIKIIVRVLLSGIALYLGGRGIAIVKINFAMTLCAGLFSSYYVLAKLKLYPKISKIEKKFILEIVGYSFFIFLQMLATQFNAMVGPILIGAFIPSSAALLGVYSVGALIATYFQHFGTAINGVVMPGVVKLIENNSGIDRIQLEMIKVGRIVLMFLGIIYVGFLVFGSRFILLWAGQENREAYYVAVIIMAPMLFSLTESVGSQVLWAMNKHKIQAILKTGISIINILLTLILIRWRPLLGAAIGTSIALLIGDVLLLNIIFIKEIGISLKDYFIGLIKGILPCLLIAGIVGYFVSMIKILGWIGLGFGIIVMTSLYCTLMLCKGLNSKERSMLKLHKYKL